MKAGIVVSIPIAVTLAFVGCGDSTTTIVYDPERGECHTETTDAGESVCACTMIVDYIAKDGYNGNYQTKCKKIDGGSSCECLKDDFLYGSCQTETTPFCKVRVTDSCCAAYYPL